MFKKLQIFALSLAALIVLAAATDSAFDYVTSERPQLFRSGIYVGTTTNNPEADTMNKITSVLGINVDVRFPARADAGHCVEGTTEQHFNDYDGGVVLTCTGCNPDGGLGVYLAGVAKGDPCMIGLDEPALSHAQASFTCRVSANGVITPRMCAHVWPQSLAQMDAGVQLRVIGNGL